MLPALPVPVDRMVVDVSGDGIDNCTEASALDAEREALLAAGATVAGKAVCEDLCFSGGSHTSSTGPVRNPWDPSRTTGGSSSGSAALVASGEVDLALGGDQGGEARPQDQPLPGNLDACFAPIGVRSGHSGATSPELSSASV